MRSILSRVAIAGVAAVLAVSAIAPASAATRHKRAPAQGQLIDQPVAARPGQTTFPNLWPNECTSDEGYGRYSLCDQGAS
jgi:hypothetical protein